LHPGAGHTRDPGIPLRCGAPRRPARPCRIAPLASQNPAEGRPGQPILKPPHPAEGRPGKPILKPLERHRLSIHPGMVTWLWPQLGGDSFRFWVLRTKAGEVFTNLRKYSTGLAEQPPGNQRVSRRGAATSMAPSLGVLCALCRPSGSSGSNAAAAGAAATGKAPCMHGMESLDGFPVWWICLRCNVLFGTDSQDEYVCPNCGSAVNVDFWSPTLVILRNPTVFRRGYSDQHVGYSGPHVRPRLASRHVQPVDTSGSPSRSPPRGRGPWWWHWCRCSRRRH
jgi:hypothetical protein